MTQRYSPTAELVVLSAVGIHNAQSLHAGYVERLVDNDRRCPKSCPYCPFYLKTVYLPDTSVFKFQTLLPQRV